ncbi:MAG: LysM peptidoglycan-binding domain-containing protein [Bacteroidota bacterium]
MVDLPTRGLLILFCLLGAFPALGQLVSTRPPLSARAQIMLHLDQVEQTWWVQEARRDAARKGSAPGADPEPILPSDLQLSLQMKAIQGDLDFELYPGVKEYVRLFGLRKRPVMEAIMGLQKGYFPLLEAELAARNLPENLKFLPVALSGLNTAAIAEHGPTGLWQLPYHAAVRYGLVCTAEIDERRHPAKATRAALNYLQDLHRRYGDWTLAITAFTCGPAGLQRARNRAGQNADFEALYPFLPESGRDYLPAYFAATYVLRYHQIFGLHALEVHLPERKDILQVPEPIGFAPIAQVLGLSEAQLRAYNPTCRTAAIPLSGNAATVYLPLGQGQRFAALKDSIYAVQRRRDTPPVTAPHPPTKPTPPPNDPPVEMPPATPPTNSAPVTYRIQVGDNLGAIARWFAVPLSDLKAWNRLENDNIRAGESLIVHVPKRDAARLKKLNDLTYAEKEASLEPGKAVPESSNRPKLSRDYRIYTVKSGDSLWAISQKYPGVSAEDIMQVNNITEDIRPGMKLKIPTPAQ